MNHHIYEWLKLMNIYMVMVLANMEDEWTFSNLVFIIQNKFQNCLTTHFKLILKNYS
jgi:hypothetical protein